MICLNGWLIGKIHFRVNLIHLDYPIDVLVTINHNCLYLGLLVGVEDGLLV